MLLIYGTCRPLHGKGYPGAGKIGRLSIFSKIGAPPVFSDPAGTEKPCRLHQTYMAKYQFFDLGRRFLLLPYLVYFAGEPKDIVYSEVKFLGRRSGDLALILFVIRNSSKLNSNI